MRSNLGALVLLATAFGVVEAAIVVVLRRGLDPTGTAFPVVEIPSDLWHIEVVREVCTLIVLAGAAHLAGATRVARFAAFLIGFGTWDLVYYVALRLWMDWPASWATWDLLFLVPVPWFGPVYAPICVALVMLAAGWIGWRHEARGGFRVAPLHFAAAITGAMPILASFILPAREARPPSRYPWEWLVAGLAIGITAFVHAWQQNRRRSPAPVRPAEAFSSDGAPTNTVPARRARRLRDAR